MFAWVLIAIASFLIFNGKSKTGASEDKKDGTKTDTVKIPFGNRAYVVIGLAATFVGFMSGTVLGMFAGLAGLGIVLYGINRK